MKTIGADIVLAVLLLAASGASAGPRLRLFFVFLLLQVSGFILQPCLGQVPTILNYQGRVAVNGTNFDGTGLFKFALVDSVTNSLWSNDGTSVLGGEPSGAVSLPVSKAVFRPAGRHEPGEHDLRARQRLHQLPRVPADVVQ